MNDSAPRRPPAAAARLEARPDHAQLQKIYRERPDAAGHRPCDTWDNAVLHATVDIGGEPCPCRWR